MTPNSLRDNREARAAAIVRLGSSDLALSIAGGLTVDGDLKTVGDDVTESSVRSPDRFRSSLSAFRCRVDSAAADAELGCEKVTVDLTDLSESVRGS